MNAVDRFTLLLLEPGEIFFNDHSAVYRLPNKDTEEKEGWEKSFGYPEIKGRLKICSKSLVFDPRTKEIPIIKFPLKNCTHISEGNPSHCENSALHYRVEGCTIKVESEVSVEILENNVTKPYKFRKKKFLHHFDLSYKKASSILPQIHQLHRASTLPPCDQNVMIEAIVRSLQKRKGFDYANLKDVREERIVELEANRVTPLVTNPGRVLVTNSALYFQPFNNTESKIDLLRVPLEDIKQIIKRRYLLRHVGIELQYVEKNCSRFLYLALKLQSERDEMYQSLQRQQRLRLDSCCLEKLIYRWQLGVISNFEYLSHINSLGDRSVNDLTQYPVFPWVIADYHSSELDLSRAETFRDLSKPVGALNEQRLNGLKERAKDMPEPKFLYGSHYSTPGFALFYLVRQFPQLMLCLQNGKFDHPDRMFNSVSDTWYNVTTNPSDFKELIPEFYDVEKESEFLQNRKAIAFGTRQNGNPVWDVGLPPWAKSPSDFIYKLRDGLESTYVSENLHHWIDLIFGYKQKGLEAIKADNVFYHLCYEGSVDIAAITDLNEKISLENQIMEFGQIPKQIFITPHPKKSSSLCLYSDFLLRDNTRPARSTTLDSNKNYKTSGKTPRLLNLFRLLDSIKAAAEAKLHRNAVTHVSFVSAGKMVISLSKDGCLKAYSLPHLQRAGSLDVGSLAFSTCVHLPNTSEVLIGSWDNYLYRFNYKLCQKRDSLQAHSDAISCMDIDRHVLITGSWDCLVRVWEMVQISSISEDSSWSDWKLHMDHLICQMDHDAPVNCVALNPVVESLVSATTEGFVNVWPLRRDHCLLNVKCHEGAVNAAIWCPEGARILSCGNDGHLILLNVESECFFSVVRFELSLRSLLWDGRMALVGRDDGKIFWIDVANSERLRVFQAHSGPVTTLSLSPDCHSFVSGGEDRRVVLWTANNCTTDD